MDIEFIQKAILDLQKVTNKLLEMVDSIQNNKSKNTYNAKESEPDGALDNKLKEYIDNYPNEVSEIGW